MHAVQEEVDRARHDIMAEFAQEILHDERQGKVFADWAVYILFGYEQTALPRTGPHWNG